MTRTIDGNPYYLSLTDTAGQEEYRGLWAASNLRSDAFLLVYDITSSSSLSELSYFSDMIAMEEETRQDAGALLPVKIVAGNKCDLKELREVPARKGLEWARGRGAGFMETSARECVNIEETFVCRLSPFFSLLLLLPLPLPLVVPPFPFHRFSLSSVQAREAPPLGRTAKRHIILILGSVFSITSGPSISYTSSILTL